MSDDRCKTEQECTQAPWCRINGICQRTRAKRPLTTMERVVSACKTMKRSQLVRTIPLGELCQFLEAAAAAVDGGGVRPVEAPSFEKWFASVWGRGDGAPKTQYLREAFEGGVRAAAGVRGLSAASGEAQSERK